MHCWLSYREEVVLVVGGSLQGRLTSLIFFRNRPVGQIGFSCATVDKAIEEPSAIYYEFVQKFFGG
ncbi:MAG: hypothetical protein C5B47_00780 [Verrucomicrobia bacterium]|nr:MAG: hypothetical protein C5B47_00780 [Verrucomicrobiota bacterium]